MSALWKLRKFFSEFRSVAEKLDATRAARLSYGDHHRSGWNRAIPQLQLFQKEGGVFVDAFVERTLLWGTLPDEQDRGATLHNRPWIGFVHIPSHMPDWYDPEFQPKNLLQTTRWNESKKKCLGLFCLSDKETEAIQRLTKVRCHTVRYPNEKPESMFSKEKFLGNSEKTILQIGYWLRKLHSIYFLKTPGWKKAILPGLPHLMEKAFELEKKQFHYEVDRSSIPTITYQNAGDYDELLSKNLVFLDLYDSSANNVIVECIVRNTPILVNKIPPVVEYLGESYPYYFHTLEEASSKAVDLELACKAHEYLKSYPKEKFSNHEFIKNIVTSQIYRDLPS